MSTRLHQEVDARPDVGSSRVDYGSSNWASSRRETRLATKVGQFMIVRHVGEL